MAGQVARLFARGSLVNKTARNLTPEEKERVDELWYEVWNDPALQTQKREFCMALARTIGGEYSRPDKYVKDWKDLGAQMADLAFAFWRTCVDVLYHNPKPDVVENRGARLKYFKTHMFNYLRQILNENKIPVHKESKQIGGLAHHVAKQMVISVFLAETKTIQYDLEEDEDTIIFHMNTRVLPNKMLKKIWAVRDKVAKHGVTVATYDDAIWVYTDPGVAAPEISLAVTKTTKLSFVSDAHIRSSGEDDGFGKHVEFVASKQHSGVGDRSAVSKSVSQRDKEAPLMDGVMIQDITETLNSRLDQDSRDILAILLNPPKAFTDKYFANRKKEITLIKDSQIADYLGLKKETVNHKRELIKRQAEALDLKPVG